MSIKISLLDTNYAALNVLKLLIHSYLSTLHEYHLALNVLKSTMFDKKNAINTLNAEYVKFFFD